MFNTSSKDSYSTPLEGIEMKTLMAYKFRLQKGRAVPLHSHLHELAGYPVSGQVKFTVGSKEVMCRPGDSWCIEGDKDCGAEALQDSVLARVFLPGRGDYLSK